MVDIMLRCVHLLRKMTLSMRLAFVAVALLTAPITSRGQECDLPTEEDAESVGGFYLSSDLPGGAEPITMTVHDMSFTCLARVAFDKYSYASVVVNATDSANTPFTTVRQFQLQCTNDGSWDPHGLNEFDSNIPSDPFNIEAELRCSDCLELSSNTANYNNVTNCFGECMYLFIGRRRVRMNFRYLSACSLFCWLWKRILHWCWTK